MGIKSELHEAILKRGGKIPPHGGIAAALDELNRLPSGGGVTHWDDLEGKPFGIEEEAITLCDIEFTDPSSVSEVSPISITVGDTISYKYTFNKGTEHEGTYEGEGEVIDWYGAIMLQISTVLDVAFGEWDGNWHISLIDHVGVSGGNNSLVLATVPKIVTIDPKYLPESTAGIVTFCCTPDYSVEGADYADILSAIENHKPVIGVVNYTEGQSNLILRLDIAPNHIKAVDLDGTLLFEILDNNTWSYPGGE